MVMHKKMFASVPASEAFPALLEGGCELRMGMGPQTRPGLAVGLLHSGPYTCLIDKVISSFCFRHCKHSV